MEGEDLTFSIHLEENHSPENLQWDIRKTYLDVIYFRNRWEVKGVHVCVLSSHLCYRSRL